MQTIITTGSRNTSITESGTAANPLLQIIPFPEYYPLTYIFELPKVSVTDNEIIDAERARYEQNKSKYLHRYEGKYIALINGEVVGSAIKFSNLAKKIYSKYGYRAIFMIRVEEKERQYKMASPKFKAKIV